MKVLLKQDVASLGKKGTVVEVSDGYARNFLVPRGLAVEATEGVLRHLSHETEVTRQKQQRELEEARKLYKAIHLATVNIPVKAGAGGKLFGSITSQDVVDAVRKQLKVTLDKKELKMEENLKTLGVHPVRVRLHPEIEAVINVALISS
ncbi:MAG: 50S ribosomal protein L9 [Bacillota bacterium]